MEKWFLEPQLLLLLDNGDVHTDISPENAVVQGQRSSKCVDYLVEASAAEVGAITATLAAIKATQVKGAWLHGDGEERQRNLCMRFILNFQCL
ncbi:serine/threonine-protein phosphatase BSL2 homolog isoform X3 [Triticum dicoccoides]|uniref:serine/threonine-protein phosphatase BSL2 homolog isoform X3 n=1 Tax=Triticum dicoccoides TaxID=85692 RepID=UPI001890F19C|nr:serine/threonine-protein phosphatase BSL2 homolog isoform X3 [Triticum dicoccoides]